MASEQQENFIKNMETLTEVLLAIPFSPRISLARKYINNMKILLWKKRFQRRVVLKAFFPLSFFPLRTQPFSVSFFIVNVFAEDLEYLWMIMFHWLPYRLENWKAIPPNTAKLLQSLFTEARRVMSGRLFDRDARRRSASQAVSSNPFSSEYSSGKWQDVTCWFVFSIKKAWLLKEHDSQLPRCRRSTDSQSEYMCKLLLS